MEWETKLKGRDDRVTDGRAKRVFAWLPKRVSDTRVVWLGHVLRLTTKFTDLYGGGWTYYHSYRSLGKTIPLVVVGDNLFDNWEDYDKHFPYQTVFDPLSPANRNLALDWLDTQGTLNVDFTMIEEAHVHPPIWAFKDKVLAVRFKIRFMS